MQNTTTTEVTKPTNLNFLFQDQITNFAHLITIENQTKEQFINNIKTNYSETNPKTSLFIQSCERSEFETIRLNKTRDSILFNQ